METNGKEIKKLTANYTNGKEVRAVDIQVVENGRAFVQPRDFNPDFDGPEYYHGFYTDVKNIRDVSIVYADGEKTYLGDPPCNAPIAIPLVVDIRTKVL